tara:strand:- start:1333 stop:2118 length:786 start_codon:yes stop_codon:yes gene_type:complete
MNKPIKSYTEYLKEEHPSEYKAPKGSKRDTLLKKVQKLLKGSEADKKKAYEIRDKMEADEREKTNETIDPKVDLTEFAEKRGDSAKNTVSSSKEKGGFSMLSYDHFKVKIPYYEKAAKGNFDMSNFKDEYDDLINELVESTSKDMDITQKKFQEIVGKIEVLGELCIRNKDTEPINEAKKAKKKKKKKTLSKATEAKIRKVANKKGYTFGSLKAEYIKGLGAFYSSGSRPGMTAHGWAMARVNKATPSKPWANVKKSKAKK